MLRQRIEPRPDWVRRVEDTGMAFHHLHHEDGTTTPYWDESAYYSFSRSEIAELQAASNAVHNMALDAVEHIITKKRFRDFGISPALGAEIEYSWRQDALSIYGRFDWFYDGDGPPKLYEYDADFTLLLFESAVVQWQWAQERFPKATQWNLLHDRLVSTWRLMRDKVYQPVHFAFGEEDPFGEEMLTAVYLLDTANQAGVEAKLSSFQGLQWNDDLDAYVDEDGRPVDAMFKFSPWDQLLAEEGFTDATMTSLRNTQWIEPVWKMLIANKALLAVLWELFPEHPNLLPAYFEADRLDRFVFKPIRGHNGESIRWVDGRSNYQTPGRFSGDSGIFQQMAPLPLFDGRRALLSTWVVGNEAVGMCVRESVDAITKWDCTFVPHIVV